MFATLKRAFRKMDTSEVDAAIADACAEHKAVRVRARALRMDVSCGNPVEAIAAMRGNATSAFERLITGCFGPPERTPDDMQRMLHQIGGSHGRVQSGQARS